MNKNKLLRAILGAGGGAVATPIAVDLLRGKNLVPGELTLDLSEELVLPAGAIMYKDVGDFLAKHLSAPHEVTIPSLALALGGAGAYAARSRPKVEALANAIKVKAIPKPELAVSVAKPAVDDLNKKLIMAGLAGAGTGAGLYYGLGKLTGRSDS
jgi:hypothetical protein